MYVCERFSAIYSSLMSKGNGTFLKFYKIMKKTNLKIYGRSFLDKT